MATSNFQQFNPTLANQETDAEYLVDSTRTGGAGVDAIWPSPSANKTLYQASTAITALMQMMANKGFTVSDASLAALTTQLSNILTTADILSNLQSVSWASSIALNAARYNGFQIALSGNSALSISGQTVGQVIVLLFAQDGTGGHTVTYSGSFVGGVQPDPTASTISGQIFKVNAVGVLQALGPMVSANGMSGMALGAVNPALVNASTLQVASTAPNGQVLVGNGTSYVPRLGAPITAVRTDKTGTYLSGVTYTNSASFAVFEEVTMIGPENDNTGRSYSIRSVINGVTGPTDSIENYSYGYAYIGFWVSAGGTFTVTLTQDTGGIVSPPPSISQWTEVSF